MITKPFPTKRSLNGVGIGLRTPHLAQLLDPDNILNKSVPWLEILTDNYLNVGGFFAAHLSALGERYPLTFHGVGLSIGSQSPLNKEYLLALKKLADKHQPIWVSDHLSWSNHHQERSHDLLPLAYTEDSLRFLCKQVDEVQNFLERPLMLENISAYYAHPDNTIDEATFLKELCNETSCSILLDVNNLYVNQHNLEYDLETYLGTLPFDSVQQLHLGGHETRDKLLVDTHGANICDEVWDLYRHIVSSHGDIPTLIEWDNNIPELAVLLSERDKAENIMLFAKTNKQHNATASFLSHAGQ